MYMYMYKYMQTHMYMYMYMHRYTGPKTVRNGPREHFGAISLLPSFVHPADSPETKS